MSNLHNTSDHITQVAKDPNANQLGSADWRMPLNKQTYEARMNRPRPTQTCHTKGRNHSHHTQTGAAPIGTVVFPFVCVVWCVVFYVSVLLCGARVLDDVRREAQAGQRTRKARSQVLPCKPRYSAYACWLRKDLQEKSTFPKKDIIFINVGYKFASF